MRHNREPSRRYAFALVMLCGLGLVAASEPAQGQYVMELEENFFLTIDNAAGAFNGTTNGEILVKHEMSAMVPKPTMTFLGLLRHELMLIATIDIEHRFLRPMRSEPGPDGIPSGALRPFDALLGGVDGLTGADICRAVGFRLGPSGDIVPSRRPCRLSAFQSFSGLRAGQYSVWSEFTARFSFLGLLDLPFGIDRFFPPR